MPEPGTTEWTEFLKRLKEEAPEDYRKALLLGGGITTALQKEIQRSKRRDAIQGLFNRLFFRTHQGKAVPDKRKIGLLVFAIVGVIFSLAFFVGTAPKKEASGGGIAGVSKGIADSESKSVVPEVSSTKTEPLGPASVEKADSAVSSSGSTGSPLVSGGTNSPSSTAPSGGNGEGSTPGTAPSSVVPPPPPPVYGSATSVPPPPDAAYGATGTGGGAVLSPPPMVLYADPGMPVSVPQASQPGTPPPASTGTPPSALGGTGTEGSGSPMLFIAVQPSSMMVVNGEPPTTVSPENPSPAYPGGSPPIPTPPAPQGGTPGGGMP